MINPKQYKIAKIKSKRKKSQNIMLSPFIGVNKNKKEWKIKSAIDIANDLRKNAWYGS